MQSGRERLREWIERSKMNQTAAAELLSIHPVMLSQILNGARNPGLPTAVAIEDVTGIPVRSWTLSRVSEAKEAATVAVGKRPITKR